MKKEEKDIGRKNKMPNYPIHKTRKIKYDSPSGYVNISKYQPPFEKVKKGFGYMGVVIEDYKSGQLQCNICGKWYEQMARHIEIHKINSEQYKVRFGLSQSTALKSKRMRLIQSKVMSKLRKNNPQNRGSFKKNNSYASNRKDKPKSLETINKYGVCDLQVTHKVLELKKKLGKTPTLIDLKDEYGAGFIFQIHKRYSYVKFCRDLELEPNFSNYNPKYSRQYFIEKGLSNEPTIRILTINESRAFYKYFKGGVKQWRKEVNKYEKQKFK